MTLPENSYVELEHLFIALGDKTRLKLLAVISEGEASVGFLADELNASQPKVSRHLAYLRSAGLVTARRDGKQIYYSTSAQENADHSVILRIVIESITGGSDLTIHTDQRSVRDNDEQIYANTYMNDQGNPFSDTQSGRDPSGDIEIFLL